MTTALIAAAVFGGPLVLAVLVGRAMSDAFAYVAHLPTPSTPKPCWFCGSHAEVPGELCDRYLVVPDHL